MSASQNEVTPNQVVAFRVEQTVIGGAGEQLLTELPGRFVASLRNQDVGQDSERGRVIGSTEALVQFAGAVEHADVVAWDTRAGQQRHAERDEESELVLVALGPFWELSD